MGCINTRSDRFERGLESVSILIDYSPGIDLNRAEMAKVFNMSFNYSTDEPTSEGKSVQSLIRNKDSRFYHIFNFLAEEYGNNTEKMLARINSILALGLSSQFIQNRKLRSITRIAQTGLAATLFGTEFVMHIKHYIDMQKKSHDNPFKKRMGRVCKILEIPKDHPFYINVPYNNYWINIEIVNWFLRDPKTSKVAVKKYVNMSTCEELEEVDLSKVNEIGILMEFEGKKILWDISARVVMDMPLVDNSWLLSEAMTDDFMSRVRKGMLYDYTQSLDIEKNIVKFDSSGGIITRPRRNVLEKINQFDVDRVIEEMKEVLRHSRKRAFAFVGRQGVGKSSILRLIEERMSDYMVLHLTPEDFDNAHKIIDRFDIAKMFQPLILIIEDLDSCGLKTKNSKTGAFLDCIDDVNRDLHCVILVSINDTGMVHQTIINRPGRFDRVFEVMAPHDVQEAYEVVCSKAESLAKDYCPDLPFSLPPQPSEHMVKNLEKCLKERFTQAEFTSAVTEQVFIDINIEINHGHLATWDQVSISVFDKFFETSIEKHLATKKAIKQFRFNSEIGDDYDDTEVCGQSVARAYGDYEAPVGNYGLPTRVEVPDDF